jgi:hypothetical protein
LLARLGVKYAGPSMHGQTASGRTGAMAAMLKPDGGRYSAHAMKI